MATQPTKKNTSFKNTSLVKNTSRAVTLKGNAAKTAAKKTNVAKKATPAKKTVQSKRKPYRRNSATPGLFASTLAAFTGAFVINLFDYGVNKVFPNLSGSVRTGSKIGAGVLMLMYGSKVSFLRSYSPIIGNSLLLAGALDIVGNYVMPKVAELLSGGLTTISNVLSPTSQVVATAPVQDTATGELGRAYTLSNGQVVEVYGNRPGWQGNFAY